MSAHVSCGVVGFGEINQGAEDGVGYHYKEGQRPCSSDDFVGVGSGLPRPRLKRVADRTVSLYCYSHQTEGRYAH